MSASPSLRPPHSDLEEAIEQLEIQATSFAVRFINDSRVRQDYIHKTQAMSREMRAAYDAGVLSAKEAAEAAHQMRDEIRTLARVRTSDVGLAWAKELKRKGFDFEYYCTKYADELFKQEFDILSAAQKEKVFLEIVDSGGRARPAVNAAARRLGAVGRGLWVLTAVVAVYNVGTAEDKVHAAGREVVNLGGGYAGSVAAGAVAGLWLGPVGVAVGAVIGGVLGAIMADTIYIEVTGPREASVRSFLPRFTSVFGVDEAGIANALVDDYGIDMDSVIAVFRELSNSYTTDSDDVAVLYVQKVRDRGGSIAHALHLHEPLRNLLVLILDDGWTTDEERRAMDYLRKP